MLDKICYGFDNIIHSVIVLCVLHTKKEREEDATEYALGSGNIIHSVSVLYIYDTVKRRGRRMLQNMHCALAI